jgi:hypothetical protein
LPANFSFVEPSTCIPEAVIEGATVPIEDVVLDQETSMFPIEDVVLDQETSMFNSNTMDSFISI